jgi:hypothetical protein
VGKSGAGFLYGHQYYFNFFPHPLFIKKFKKGGGGGAGGGGVVYFDSCTPRDPSPSSWVNPDLHWCHGKNHCWVVTWFRGLEPEVTESELVSDLLELGSRTGIKFYFILCFEEPDLEPNACSLYMWNWNHNRYPPRPPKTTVEVNWMLIIRFQSGLPGIGFDFHIQN